MRATLIHEQSMRQSEVDAAVFGVEAIGAQLWRIGNLAIETLGRPLNSELPYMAAFRSDQVDAPEA